jgi:hypothetical protein
MYFIEGKFSQYQFKKYFVLDFICYEAEFRMNFLVPIYSRCVSSSRFKKIFFLAVRVCHDRRRGWGGCAHKRAREATKRMT